MVMIRTRLKRKRTATALKTRMIKVMLMKKPMNEILVK
jgi:hypothetical protein